MGNKDNCVALLLLILFNLVTDPLENNNLAEALDSNRLKQLIKYIKYENFELNDKATGSGKRH